MKKKSLLLFALVAFIFAFQGCKKDDSEPDTNNQMEDLIIPNGFTFETTQDVEISITMPEAINFDDLRSRFNVYTALPEEGGKLITSGSFDASGKYTGIMRIPTMLEEITVSTIAGIITIPVQNSSFKEGGVIIDFGDDYGYYPPDSVDPSQKSSRLIANNINYVKSNSSGPNIIGNGDFELNDFGTINYWSDPHPVDSRWYFTTFRETMLRTEDNGNFVLSTPNTTSWNNFVGGASQMIEASPGDVITLSADIRSTGNSTRMYSWIYLIPVNANGNALAYYTNVYYYPSNSWTNKSLTATMPAGTAKVNVLLWANDYYSNSAIYFDNVVVTGPVTDSDNDGVDDDLDDYPNDATRAFDVYYPNEDDWGTFAFEDLWPGTGDYDFNDLVVDYQFKSVLNSDNGLVELFTDYSVRAVGASLVNGFALQLPGDPTNVSSVTGTNIAENYLNISANGTEQNQSSTVIFLFDNSFNMIGSSGSAFINTKEDVPYVNPDTNQLHVVFTNPAINAGHAPYNPFIVVDKDRGVEVHLAGYEPTDLADQTIFGTWADDTDPATGKYYQSINNLPWAIDVPVSFDYPVEQVQIIDAYNYFKTWGESGGTSYTDWYEDNSGYRNSANIYTPTED